MDLLKFQKYIMLPNRVILVDLTEAEKNEHCIL